ncbi:replicative DNA helicase [Psychrobacillus sp. NPDC096426]|uniref:replicative DNA helicase n=1 Tax=Psychrobacillus sp. NPDC096426 TaxID=3364491 RepID=UPI0037FB646F
MESYEWEGLTDGYKERMRRLALFDSLYELQRKQKKDVNGTPIDMQGLGLLTLLFFFEHKLLRNNKAGTVELAAYILHITEQKYELSPGQEESLAKELVEAFRPPDGRKRTYSFYNWETRQDESISYSILKDNNFDAASGRQFYTLDEDGLELIFATKEFYSEYQLSINQLMIRKQLEKGEYGSALRQMNEMHINVETLRERMTKLKHEVLRNIVSEDTFERYKKLLEDIRFRLTRENEEFVELENFVHETRTRLFEKDYHLEQPKAYSYILSITKELESVHNEHSKLLTESQILINDTLVAAQQSLYYMGVEAFNFKQDILLPIVTKPLPLETMKGVLHPFFKLPYAQLWSPLSVLQEQHFREEREETVEDAFMQPDEELVNSAEHLLLKEHFTAYLEVLLDALDTGVSTLDELIKQMRETEHEAFLHRRTFYHFLLYIHQRSPIRFNVGETDEEQIVNTFYEAFKLLGSNELKVVELTETIEVTKRYSIQNMEFTLVKEVEMDAL